VGAVVGRCDWCTWIRRVPDPAQAAIDALVAQAPWSSWRRAARNRQPRAPHCADHDAHPVGRETPVAITKKSPSIAPIQALRVPNETIAEYERYYDVETLDVPGGGIPEPTNDLDGHCRFSTQQGGTRIQERGASRAPHHWKRRKMARLSCGDGRDSAREAHGKEGVNGSSPLEGSAVSVWLSQI
jgi:hypothetical protein